MVGPAPAFPFPRETTVSTLLYGRPFVRATCFPSAWHSVAVSGVQS